MNVRVYVTPKHGILDPQGAAVERSLPNLGFTGVSGVQIGKIIDLTIDGDGLTAEAAQRAGRRHVPQAARQPDHRGLHVRDQRGLRHELRPRALRRRRLPRDQLRRRHPPRLSRPSPASPREYLWHKDTDLKGRPGHRHPRRLQLRRLPALRRHRPLQPDHAVGRRLRRRRRPRDGHLQRLPDPHRGRPPARRPHPQHRPQVRLPLRQPARRDDGDAVHQRLRSGRAAAHRRQAQRGQLHRRPRDAGAHEGQRPDRAALRRTPPASAPRAPTPTAPSTTSPASATRRATSSA